MSVGSGISATDQGLSPELADLRATIAQIARERIAPRAGEIDRSAEYPQDIRELLAETTSLRSPSRSATAAPAPAR